MPKYDFESFFEHSVDMLSVASVNGYFLRVNPSFQRVLGWTTEEILNHPFIEFAHPDDVEATLAESKKWASGNPTLSFINRYRCSNGDYRHLLWTAYPEKDTGFLFIVAHDITELTDANLRVQLALDASPAALLMIDEQGIIQLVNKGAENLFGYTKADLIEKSIEMLVPAEVHIQHQQDRIAFFQNPKPRPMGTGRHLLAVRRDGVVFPVEIGLNPIKVGERMFVLCSVIDMTLQKQVEERMIHLTQELESANKKLAQLAITDRLTGILNRRAFDDQFVRHIQLASRTNHPISLLMVDIDQFKEYNDKYGHLVGDATLKEVAKLIEDKARVTDVVARFGGEEFGCILPNTEKEGALQMAERICEVMQSYPWAHGKVTLSIGISTIHPSIGTEEELMECVQGLIADADRALYYSKKNGKNRFTHASEISTGDDGT